MERTMIIAVILVSAMLAYGTTVAMPLEVAVQRNGGTYLLSARFDTSLSQCEAYRYLTDYESAIKLPGIVDSRAFRESDNKVRVERTAEERVLFMRIHLHSVMEFTEHPNDRLDFFQISGDSKAFSGQWTVAANTSGSTLHFQGEWTPDTLLPLFIIDHFAEHDLERRFGEIARLAEAQKPVQSAKCLGTTDVAAR